MTSAELVLLKLSPWLAGGFAIAAAVVSERAFAFASATEPPDEWRGSHDFFTDFHHDEEVTARRARDVGRIRAATSQSIATFLAAASAIEATAATQEGLFCAVLALTGILLAALPTTFRVVSSARKIAYTKAWYCNVAWSMKQGRYANYDKEAEDAAFAKDHPKEAAALKRTH